MCGAITHPMNSGIQDIINSYYYLAALRASSVPLMSHHLDAAPIIVKDRA
jgi:hypothetical protein